MSETLDQVFMKDIPLVEKSDSGGSPLSFLDCVCLANRTAIGHF